MKKLNRKNGAILVVIVALSPTLGFAQPKTIYSAPNTYRANGNLYPSYFSLDWMNEQWTGDDAPYRAIRAQVEKLRSSKELSEKVVADYKSAYLRKPNDSKLFFRWAYALEYKPAHGKWREYANELVTNHFWKVPSPKTYEYSRLRWITQATVGPALAGDKRKLVVFGEKLLKRNPKDVHVLYQLINWVEPPQAVSYSEKLMQLAPNLKSSLATLAFAYFGMFLQTHTQKDADRAIKAYQQLLTRVPASDKEGQKEINSTIDHIRRVRTRWANKTP